MKILHLLSSNQFSGAENVVCQIIHIFSNTKYEMIYCSPDGQIREILRERGFKYIALKKLSTSKVRSVLERIKPDLIHAHDMKASYIASKVCGNIPLVSHVHNNGFDARKLSLKTLGYLWASRKILHIFWVSKSALNDFYFYKRVKNKSSVLPNIIDLQELNCKANSVMGVKQFDIVFLGRLAYPKNPMRFVEIINKVASKLPNIRAAIIGDGNQAEITKKKVEELKLSNNVFFLGYLKNPFNILKNAKALVMTSFWEGTPMCALEALGLGTPVISTPVDGLKDIIINNRNGYLSECDFSLTNELIRILKDYNYYSVLSKNAFETAVKINNIDCYRNKLGEIYDSAYKSKL